MMSAVNCLFIFVTRVIHYRGNFVSHDFSAAGLVSFGVFSLTIDLRAIDCLFLILLGYRVVLTCIISISMRRLSGEVIIILCHHHHHHLYLCLNLYRHHQSLTASSYLLESHIWLDSESKKQYTICIH